MEILSNENKNQKICGLKCKLFLPIFFLTVFSVSIIVSFIFFIYPVPNSFQTGKIFDIPKGANIIEIAKILETKGFINSAESFIILDKTLSLFDKRESMKAGKYVFKKKQNLLEVYQKIASGESGIEEIELKIIPGEANYSIAKRFSQNKKLKKFSEKKFLELAKNYEGFLYPETRMVSPFTNEKIIIEIFREEFQKQTKGLFDNLSSQEIKDIITIASLIENEANGNYKTKQHISGIIQNRLKKGMKLQIDAVFSYIYGYHLKNVFNSHLKNESLYNTYKYPGLPPGPIGNPGIESIKAALNPLKTKDLYYLTGKDGNFYYAKTSAGHFQNIKNYLK